MEEFTTVYLGTPDTKESLAKMMIKSLVDYCGLTAGDADGLIADWGDNMSFIASTASGTGPILTLNTISGGKFPITQTSQPKERTPVYLTYAKGVAGEVAFGFSPNTTQFFLNVFLQPHDAAVVYSSGFRFVTATSGTTQVSAPSIGSTSWPFVVLYNAPLPVAGEANMFYNNIYIPYCIPTNFITNYQTVLIIDGSQKYVVSKVDSSGNVYMALRVA